MPAIKSEKPARNNLPLNAPRLLKKCESHKHHDREQDEKQVVVGEGAECRRRYW